MLVNGKHYRTVWMEGHTVLLIDQTLIPSRLAIVSMQTHQDTVRAIKDMIVRGAGAIGAAAGYGMAQVILEARDRKVQRDEFIMQGYHALRSTRPTAQNLFYALDRVLSVTKVITDIEAQENAAVKEAQAIADEDAESCRRIGELGRHLLKPGMRILTHCNAGWLAFVDWGTALAPIYAAHRERVPLTVYADETRPRCQGAQLTAWELMQEGVDVYIVADNASGFMMQRGEIDLVITGADRIAANGDTANKIGTYEKAVVAKENGIPFYVAAPYSTFDLCCPNGGHIPIEERSQDEVLFFTGWTDKDEFSRVSMAPAGAKARNLAFDVTPAKYITGIITEKGIMHPGRPRNQTK